MSYEDRVKLMNIETLQSRRQQLKLCYLYKILNGLSYFVNSSLTLFSSVYNTRTHILTLNVPFTRSVSSFNSFFLSHCKNVESVTFRSGCQSIFSIFEESTNVIVSGCFHWENLVAMCKLQYYTIFVSEGL